jgi:hypothetical protein
MGLRFENRKGERQRTRAMQTHAIARIVLAGLIDSVERPSKN